MKYFQRTFWTHAFSSLNVICGLFVYLHLSQYMRVIYSVFFCALALEDQRAGHPQVSFLKAVHLVFWQYMSSGSVTRLGWLASVIRHLPISVFFVLGLQVCTQVRLLHLDFGAWAQVGPHAFEKSTLLMELSPGFISIIYWREDEG